MKIEKVNDHQIRCTLTKADLADRELKISELAYGTEKAKLLFQDMMQQAASEFGFHAEDLPLMIEAIPIPGGDPAQCRLHRFSNHQGGRSGGARHALFQICSRNGG